MSRSSISQKPADELASRRRHPTAMTCLIVEDQAMFLELLEGMLAMRGGLQIVERARTVAEGIAACHSTAADLLLLDLALPDGNGLLVAGEFLKQNPRGKVIVVTGHASSFVCPPWLDPNLQAVISKNDTFQSLRAELDELLGETRPVTASVAAGRAGKPMTKREAEIFALVGEGLTSQQIADHLGVSVHTVHTHRKRLGLKLGTRGLELTTRAVAQRAAFFGSSKNR